MEQTKRKGFRSGVQTEFTIFMNVKAGEGEALREALHGSRTIPSEHWP